MVRTIPATVRCGLSLLLTYTRDGAQQQLQAVGREVFGDDRDDDLPRGGERVDDEQTQTGWTVNQHDVVRALY